MNKFQCIFGRISAKTCLKIDYFGSYSQKSPSAGGGAPRSLFKFNDLRMCNNSTPIEHFQMMQKVDNIGAKRNLYFKFSAPPGMAF